MDKAASAKSRKTRKRPGFILIFFGIILPVTTLAIELLTHQCADTFFDPIPTWWHVALVALVPLSNLAVVCAAYRNDLRRLPWLARLNGLALGVACAYAFAFAPLMLIAAVAILFLGWGLLPLTPAISLCTLLSAQSYLRKLAPEGVRLPAAWPAALLGVVLLGIHPLQSFLTNRIIELAKNPAVEDQQRALGLLRTFGSEDAVLAAAYGNAGRRPLISGTSRNVPPATQEAAQKLYYQLTGKAFNAVPAPTSPSMRQPGAGSWNFDASLGGAQVANKVPGLSMTASRLDGKVNTAAGTSYLEWTMVFKNVAANASEARAQIELPAGAAVSRLTLWIDGEPREAAFGGRSQVRAAYQEIAVVQRRDPVLVTTAGPNRVLMQCFPVPSGGEMKVRMGITAPLRLLSEHQSAVPLPRMLETNFEQHRGFTHDLWLESDQPLSRGDRTKVSTILRESLGEADLQNRPRIVAEHTASAGEAWTEDPADPGYIIRQVVKSRPVPRPSRVALVIDGSVAMRPYYRSLVEAVRSRGLGSSETRIFFASDTVESWSGGKDAAADWLDDHRNDVMGGRDNLAALMQAWDFAAAKPQGAIIWVHGPQPVLLRSVEPFLQRIQRDAHAPRIYDLAVAAGPNRIAEELGGFRGLLPADTELTPAASLNALLAKLVAPGGGAELVAERQRIPRADLQENPTKADRHLARLWALEEVERLREMPGNASLDKAIKLALQMQLVTPVSGAVVLERAEQYERHGLEPVDPETAPTVPEPSASLLCIVGVGWLLNRRYRRSK